MKTEYQAQKVSLEPRILKKKVRGKVNTLPLPRTVQKARHAALILTAKGTLRLQHPPSVNDTETHSRSPFFVLKTRG